MDFHSQAILNALITVSCIIKSFEAKIAISTTHFFSMPSIANHFAKSSSLRKNWTGFPQQHQIFTYSVERSPFLFEAAFIGMILVLTALRETGSVLSMKLISADFADRITFWLVPVHQTKRKLRLICRNVKEETIKFFECSVWVIISEKWLPSLNILWGILKHLRRTVVRFSSVYLSSKCDCDTAWEKSSFIGYLTNNLSIFKREMCSAKTLN